MKALPWILPLALAAGCRSTPERGGEGPAPGGSLDVEVSFRGNDGLSDRELRRAIVDELGDLERLGTKAATDDAAFALEEHYRGLGFHEVRVDYRHRPQPAGGVRARFEIREGPRAVIEAIEIEGARSFDAGELARLFAGERAGLLERGGLYYSRAAVSGGVGALRSFYRQGGWLRAQVSPPIVELDPDRTRARIRVEVVEGPRFHVRKVDFGGQPGLPAEKLRAEAEGWLGRPYTPREAVALRSRLIEAHRRRGYPDCRAVCEATLDEDNGDVALLYQLEPGERVTVDSIAVSGNEKTREAFVRGRLRVEEGQLYDSEKVRKGFRELYRTGLFESVRIELAEESGAARPLQVELVEAPSLELFVEPGYGSYEGPRLTLGATERNFRGSGLVLQAEATGGALAQEATLSLTDRWLSALELTATAALFGNRRVEPSYTLEELGSSLSLAKEWTRTFRTALEYRYSLTDLRDVQVSFEGSGTSAEVRDSNVGSLSLALTWDGRDQPVLPPTSGALSQLSFEWGSSAIGSEIDFARVHLRRSQYFELREGTVAALAVRSGAIVPMGSTHAIPLQERFFNGGENSVRSFREDMLGPLDRHGEPRGGEAYSVISAELRQELAGQLSGALFADAGNVALRHEDWLRFEDLRGGIGVGLRYLLPIGPLRLDGAVNPDPRPEESDWAIHFSVGMAF